MANGPNTLIAGIGHRYWRDRSAGPEWCDRLAKLDWPPHVTVEDYSYGAWAMTQRLQDERYARGIFIAAEARERAPASLHVYRYAFDGAKYDALRVHDHLFEAVAGVVSIELLLVIAGHFGALPAETWVIEVEPADTGWGEGLSREVEALYPEVVATVRRLVGGTFPERMEAA